MTASPNLLPGVPLIESPLFPDCFDQVSLTDEERSIADQLHNRGYAVLDFPDPDLDERLARVRKALAPAFPVDFMDPASIKNTGNLRIQDAWRDNDDVRAIAANEKILALLSKLYGREAFPFQTLNFPVGTQQHVHSDAIHFSSIPERFMCGVWLAMEDVDLAAGPLIYHPGTHKWPVLTNEMLGRHPDAERRRSAQAPYELVWRAMLDRTGSAAESFLPRKGQALIWTANLLHGGGPQEDLTRTRWSQVTHYYFKDCIYYTPAYSEVALGRQDRRSIVNVATGLPEKSRYLGQEVLPEAPRRKLGLSALGRLLGRRGKRDPELPEDFEPGRYLKLNPDVAQGGADATRHYLQHGRAEQRRYR